MIGRLAAFVFCSILTAAVLMLLLESQRGTSSATHAHPCADLDGDGFVNVIDVYIVMSYFGQSVTIPHPADINSDGTIDLFNDVFGTAGFFGTLTGCQDTPLGPKGAPATPTPVPAGHAMSLTVKGAGATCDHPQKPSKCSVPAGSTFTLSTSVNAPPAAGYTGFQAQVHYGALEYKPSSVGSEVVWVDALTSLRSPISPTGLEGLVFHASISDTAPPLPVSTATGNVVDLALTCPQSQQTFEVALPLYQASNPGGTAFHVGDTGHPEVPTSVGQRTIDIDGDSELELVPVADTLLIDCVSGLANGLTVYGAQSVQGGKATIIAGQRVRWHCSSEEEQDTATLRFHYSWGDEEVSGTGSVSLSHNPPVQLESVECRIADVTAATLTTNVALIDPSGTIKDAISSAPIPGAVVTLERASGAPPPSSPPPKTPGTWTVVAEDPGLKDPQINPQTTSLTGRYGWDVLTGFWYRVQVTKPGCTSNTSSAVYIGDPVTNLDVAITCDDPDGDGLPTFVEHGGAGGTATDPNDADTDNDSVLDGDEDCENDTLTNIVEVALGSDPCGDDNVDSDLDGCSNIEEYGEDEMLGGDRDAGNYWDFFDVWTRPFGDPVNWERNGNVGLFDDIFATAARFGSEGDPFASPLATPVDDTSYHPAYDRSPAPVGASPLDLGRGTGTIDLFFDIFGVSAQFGHDCQGPT